MGRIAKLNEGIGEYLLITMEWDPSKPIEKEEVEYDLVMSSGKLIKDTPSESKIVINGDWDDILRRFPDIKSKSTSGSAQSGSREIDRW